MNLWEADPGPHPCAWPGGCVNTVPWIRLGYCAEHHEAFRALMDAPLGLAEAPARTGGHKAADMSPAAVAARKLAKAREFEAMAYVTSYTGSWGLPLDIRASERWGTKYMHLTERQADALLAGKARDIARNAEVANAATDPLIVWLKAQRNGGTFLASLSDQVRSGRNLSPRQREVAQRIMDEQIARPEASTSVVEPITEGRSEERR